MSACVDYVHIHKGGFPSSRPWVADVYWDDGTVWKSWKHGGKTRKGMTESVSRDVKAAGLGDPDISLVERKKGARST